MKEPSRVWIGVALLGVGALALAWFGVESGESAAEPSEPPAGNRAVTTVTLDESTVRLVERVPGRVVAWRSAEIRPRVDGIILERAFEEGARVNAGDLLYRLDAKPFEVALARAEAALDEALAAERIAAREVRRLEGLARDTLASEQELDRAEAALEQARANVAVARADVAAARLNLDYTTITAPINGRIGETHVDVGSLVTANQTRALAEVTALDPVYVDMSLPRAVGDRLRRSARPPERIGVSLVDERTGESRADGRLAFADHRIIESTGALKARARFENRDARLLPGMYVTARIDFGDVPGILVPQKAVTRDESGEAHVWVVEGDNTVHSRVVETARAVDDQWLVTAGVTAGDVVVTEGMHRLQESAPVTPHPSKE